MSLTIACVLKSGGDYDIEYVLNLKAGVQRHLRKEFRFVCMTDLPTDTLNPLREAQIAIYPLGYDLPGWWSKFELFRLRGPVLYFDLDTLVLGNIMPLANAVLRCQAGEMIMLKGFLQRRWGSGIMGWNGCMRWVLSDFLGLTKKREFNLRMKMSVGDKEYRGDQIWLTDLLKCDGTEITAAQDILPGIMSFKHDVWRRKNIPEDCRILVFHGRPRPRDVPGIVEIWRCGCGYDVARGVEAS